MILGPITFNKLPQAVRDEIVSYLVEGNTIEDLAVLYLKAIPHETMVEILNSVKKSHEDIGDFPHTSVLKY